MYVIAHNGATVFGGAEKAVAFLLAGLRRRGHKVLLLCHHPAVSERVNAAGVETERFRIGGDVMLPDAVRFARRLRRESPDAVLLTTFRKVPLAAAGARLARVPNIVARVGLSTDLPTKRKYRVAFSRLVDRTVVNAEEIRPRFLAALPGSAPERVLAIHNGVAAPERSGSPGALRRELGIPPDARLIGSMGRLVPQKRFDRLVRALGDLPPNVHCLLAGEGPEQEALLRLAREQAVAPRLHLPGFRSDVGDVLAALDLYLVSSDFEGMSNGMLEALAAGVPVVSTPVSGAAEALEPLEDGTAPGEVVPFGAPQLGKSIRRLLCDPARLREMGQAGVKRAAEGFSVDGMLDRWERVLGAPRSGRG